LSNLLSKNIANRLVAVSIENQSSSLKALLQSSKILAVPGVFDGMTAWLAQKAGFEAIFLSGAAVSASQLACPDIGLTTLTELASTLERIRLRTNAAILVDADSGFGNAHNVKRTIRTLEHAGASGIQLEDQVETKDREQIMLRPLVSVEQMADKIKAAQDTKLYTNTVISARTDSFSSCGLAESLDRAEAYLEAGADLIFVEGIKRKEELTELCEKFKGRAPVACNIMNNKELSALKIDDLSQMGISLVLYPLVPIEKSSNAAFEALLELAEIAQGGARVNPFGDRNIANLIDSEAYLID
jgi:2-methylisocitrate lyase-like PEP mutase family enzyme